MKFPIEFETRMKELLKEEYDAFEASFDQPPKTGLKVNTLKISVNDFIEKFPYKLTPVPWTKDGFYFDPNDPVSKHPFFYAGLFYIQEPSAMAPANILNPYPGMVILDLCAAPGGKSMQLSNAIKDQGLLVSNDINETRIKAVLRNAERFGLKNMVILNETPQNIARVIGPYFDAILIDAPCSGEGMFKKDPKAIKAWEDFGPSRCAKMQEDILLTLEKMIKNETRIVYSTCTFAKEENENQIEMLLSRIGTIEPELIDSEHLSVDGHYARIWPHIQKGEGHFMCALMVKGGPKGQACQSSPERGLWPIDFMSFAERHFTRPSLFDGKVERVKDKLYLRPLMRLPLKGLKVVREGLLLGEMKKERFIPSQALALHLKKTDFSPTLSLKADSPNVMKYLKGETIEENTEENGLHLICVEDYPLGWGKAMNGMIKNMYPPSWRML